MNNKKSSEEFGWHPEWFGCEDFNQELEQSIKLYQKEHNLKCTGYVDEATYRRIITEQEAKTENYSPLYFSNTNKYIIYNNKKIKIYWNKVKLWNEEGGIKHDKETYYKYPSKTDRKISLFVNHWDACLNSKSCGKIVNKRGLSMHFLIDNDGTIYQMLDMQHAAWQCGDRKVNRQSLGVEISNAFYTKYQEWYEKNGFGKRPIVERSYVNGFNVGKHLGFYDVQLQALAALWEAVSYGTDTELKVMESRKVEKSVLDCTYSGFVNHFNIKKRKIDCASLNMEKVLKESKRIRFAFRESEQEDEL